MIERIASGGLKSMKYYSSANELLDSEMPRSLRTYFYPIFVSGMQAYKDVIESNKTFFSSSFAANIKGPLLNYMIFRQFEPDFTSAHFPFKLQARKVNNFHYKALNLVREGLIINAGKAYNSELLPNRSGYRKKYCRLNRFNEKHLFFDIEENEMVVKHEPYFMLLTYGLNKGEIDFVNLLVPNASMTGYLKKVDLKAECLYFEPQLLHNEEMEKRMTALRTDALHKLKLVEGDI